MANLKEILRFKEQKPKLDVLLDYFKQILNYNPVYIAYDKDKPYIYYETSLEDNNTPSIQEFDENDIYYVIRNSDLKDIDDLAPLKLDKPNSYETIIHMFDYINSKGLYVTHILCNSKGDLKKPSGLDLPGFSIVKINELDTMLGARIYENEELQDGTFIACGSYSRNAEPRDIKLCVKGYLE